MFPLPCQQRRSAAGSDRAKRPYESAAAHEELDRRTVRSKLALFSKIRSELERKASAAHGIEADSVASIGNIGPVLFEHCGHWRRFVSERTQARCGRRSLPHGSWRDWRRGRLYGGPRAMWLIHCGKRTGGRGEWAEGSGPGG